MLGEVAMRKGLLFLSMFHQKTMMSVPLVSLLDDEIRLKRESRTQ